MSESTTFPHKRINELRRRAAKAAELSDDMPEGWSKSTVDPMAAEAISRESSQFYQQLHSERTWEELASRTTTSGPASCPC